MRNFILNFLLILFFVSVSFADIKTFTKEETAVVPANQSQDQVIAYLTQKLTRQANEEAGMFITSELNIKNYKITRDEFTSFTGSISKVKVEEKETFTKDKQQYVKVKVNISVDTDNVKVYLEKIMQDKQYKDEAEALRKKTFELEEKLKNATKQEYEQKLSLELQKQIEQQKQREIELNKMAVQAKEEYAKAEQAQKQKEIKRQQELNALQKQIEQENLKMQQKIALEKDNIRKAELENQAKIKELENKAKENMINWSSSTEKMSTQEAIKEATEIKKETANLFEKFEKLIKTNREDLLNTYNIQIDILKETAFPKKEPVKDSWETQEEYNIRLKKYITEKQQYTDNINNKVNEIEKIKEKKLFEDKTDTLKSMLTTIKPFVEKLQTFQTGNFYDGEDKNTKLISIDEINADKQSFILNVEYDNKIYPLEYNFSDIGRDKAKLMCQTSNQFIIEPMFNMDYSTVTKTDTTTYYTLDSFIIEPNLGEIKITTINVKNKNSSVKIISYGEFNKKTKSFPIQFNIENKAYNHSIDLSMFSTKEAKKIYKEKNIKIIPNIQKKEKEVITGSELKVTEKLVSFNIKHLGTGVETKIKLTNLEINKFDEITKYEKYKKELDEIELLNNEKNLLIKRIELLINDKNIKKNTKIIEDLNEIKYDLNHELLKLDELELYEKKIIAIEKNTIISISAGGYHTVGLKRSGTVIAVGASYYGQCDVNDWKDIISISAGEKHIVGLKKDGTVVAVGDNYYGQCNTNKWKNIVAISAGEKHTVGLKKDGTVVAVGDNASFQCNVASTKKDMVAVFAGCSHTVALKKDGTVVAVGDNYYGQCNTGKWKNIVAISAGEKHTVGLKKDGTVVAIGANDYGQCNTGKWKNIVAISAGSSHTVGLKSDGTVVAIGANYYGQCDVNDWKDIISISAGSSHTVGLKSDGTVVAAGTNDYGQCNIETWRNIEQSIIVSYGHTIGLKSDGTVVAVGANDYGQCNTGKWKNIVAISAGEKHTVGLKKDGTVVAIGSNSDGQCNVSDWENIISITAGRFHTIGLKADGTVVAVGYNGWGQCDVRDWKDIIAISAGKEHTVGLKKDGTVVAVGHGSEWRGGRCKVEDWEDIVAISAGEEHTVGLKKDGTVVAVGENGYRQCDVSDWEDIIAISAGSSHTVGLKSDGTVVAAGTNNFGQCDVSEWIDIVSVMAGQCSTIGLNKNGEIILDPGYTNEDYLNFLYSNFRVSRRQNYYEN